MRRLRKAANVASPDPNSAIVPGSGASVSDAVSNAKFVDVNWIWLNAVDEKKLKNAFELASPFAGTPARMPAWVPSMNATGVPFSQGRLVILHLQSRA